MKLAACFGAICLLLCATVATTEAQRLRDRANPFSDFHKVEALSVNKAAPALHLQDSDGKEANLRDYLGQWVFIEFGSYT